MLVHHRLSTTHGENMLGPDKASLVVGIMVGYEIDVANWIAREIQD